MDVDVISEIDINRPSEQVANYASDPDNVRKWYKNIHSVKWQTEKPLKRGSRVAFIAKFMGRTLSYTYEVVELVPGERLRMKTYEGPFPMETTYTWQRRGNATHMTLRNRGTPSGFSKLVAPFMVPAIRKTTRTDLLRLKAILEQGDI